MNKSDFTIHNFNADLSRAVSSQDLDFCRLLVMALEDNLSVTAKYTPADGEKQYMRLNLDLEPVEAEDPDLFYYGVSPALDNSLIISAISGLRLTDATGLDAFISENCGLFMLHKDQLSYIADMARYIVISMASNFGVCLRMTQKEYDRLVSVSGDFSPTTVRVSESENGRVTFKICGCPTSDMLRAMEGLRFVRDDERIWRTVPEGIDIREIYSKPENISLTSGMVFYSGVLIKPLNIDVLKGNYENDKITSICIGFERTSYATVFALDHNYTSHPLLKDRTKIAEMLNTDDRVKRQLVQDLDALARINAPTVDLLRKVNAYLDKCFNVNQIGVSANLMTKDDVMLMGRRSPASIDGECLYPGVNGNAEAADRKVAFYNESMYEDFPTIRTDSDRIDFLGEIGRECYAELKLDLPKQEWKCYGITISGDLPKDPGPDDTVYLPPSRRLHFNIIFEQSCDISFYHAEKGSHMATEAFESNKLLGVVVKCYKNRLALIWDKITDIAEGIAEQKDVVESILVLLLFLSTMMAGDRSEGLDWYTVASIVLSVIIVLSTFRKVFDAVRRAIKRERSVRHISLFEHTQYDKKDELVSRSMQGYMYHPVAYAALKLYVDNKAYDEFFHPDRRHF